MREITKEDIREWLSYLKNNYSEYTYMTYKAALKDYINWCKKRYRKAYFPNWKAIQVWLDTLAEREMSGMTRHTYYRAMKNFLRFHDMDNIIREFEKKGKVPRFKITRTETLTLKQVEKLKNKAKDPGTRLMVQLMFILGLRVSELCNLKENDYDPGRRTLRVTSKKKRGGVVYYTYSIDEETAKMIEEWLANKPKSEWMFPSPKNPRKPITPRGVRERLYNLSLKAIGRKTHPHVLRHTLGDTLAREGVPAQYIAVHLRNTISSAERYIHLRPEAVSKEIIEVLRKVREHS